MIQDTPIKKYQIKGKQVWVKREDLACFPPGPPFAKVRGLLPILEELKERGIKTVGYMETDISMAGWGVSYFCQQLNMKAVIFMPAYKEGKRHNQEFQLRKWKEFGAEILPLERPNRLQINFYRARKIFLEKYKDAVMLPQGLPFEQTIQQICGQVKLVPPKQLNGSIVSCLGSGTMAAGILRGCSAMNKWPDYYGILVSPKSAVGMRKRILKMANLSGGLLGGVLTAKFSVIDYGYEYTVPENCQCPFPCNSYYDKKAWKWLLDHIDTLKKPILFWNIGA